ncbi:MAG: hypothetical protein DIU65_10670 [Proteobacteria bacterium]|jgi:hypothetical protein|nr:MAG: hypothetical protein DIU65_10670 [Pseudomonadota bacterium]
MDDKDGKLRNAAITQTVDRSVCLLPVDAHSAPCYPIQAIKLSFRVRVKRSPEGQSRAAAVRTLPAALTTEMLARDRVAAARMAGCTGMRRRKRL